MILASNSVKAFRVSVAPSEFTSNVAEFGNPMFRLESLNPKEAEEDGEKLPAGYTRVGWIAGIGSIVDTGYYPNHNSEILIDRSGLMDYAFGSFMCGAALAGSAPAGYMLWGDANSDYAALMCVFGALSSPEQSEATTFPLPHDAVYWDPGAAGDLYSAFEGYESEIAETSYSIYMSKDELRVGAVSRPNPATPVPIDPLDIPFSLFGFTGTDGSGVVTEPSPDMIFSFKVSENGVPVVNMLPCIEDATGQPGFYDTVRNVFITGYSPDESNPGILIPGGAPPKPPKPLTPDTFVDCVTYVNVARVYPGYREIEDWNYRLDNLQIGGSVSANMPEGMFMSTQFTGPYGTPAPNTVLKTFSVDLPALTDGYYMFGNCTELTSFTGDMPALTNGGWMFYFCEGLTSFKGDLSALTDGERMFLGCTKLTSFTGDLPNLTDGYGMFRGTGLTSWDIELPKLTQGGYMFEDCTGLTSFTGDLPALTYSYYMFNGCTGLTSFAGDLSALESGTEMFWNCTGLTSFTGDLPALTSGRYMFGGSSSNCTKLDLASVQHIANTINDLASVDKTGTLYLGMDASLQDTEDLETALAAIRAKGWTVNEMYRS